MTLIRTLVVDDEPLARSRIVKLLEGHGEIRLIGESRNGQEAVQKVLDLKPDLLFLDVQMPDFNGFDVLGKLNQKQMPFVIFVTAFDRYALKAFEVHAVDYLLKPYDDERFDEAVNHAIDHVRLTHSDTFNKKLMHLVSEYQHRFTNKSATFEIIERGRSNIIHFDEIYWIEAQGNYVKLYLKNQSYLHRLTMAALEEELHGYQFLRIHRSYFVNSLFVNHIRYLGNGEYKFVLSNNKELLSGRTHKTKIQEYLSQKGLG